MSDQTIKPVAEKPTSGYASSELVSLVSLVVGLSTTLIPAEYAPVLTAAWGVYAACRTALKAVHALGYLKNIPELPDIHRKS